jgi:hypothetical protein
VALLSKKFVYFLTVEQYTIRLQVSRGIAGNEQGFVSVAEIELPQFKPQMQPD